MPGIRTMNHAAADARDGDSRKRTHDGKLVNGGSTPGRDTPAANGNTPVTMNGAVAAIAGPELPPNTPDRMALLPPELAQQAREHYSPMATLIYRTAQETYNEMTDTLRKMADLQIQPQSNGALTNGQVNGQQDNSEANKKKKLLLMQFAQGQRAKYIKLLVLKQWADKFSGPVEKLTDLMISLRDEMWELEGFDSKLNTIKEWTRDLGDPSPDMKTALQILSTGKAEWISDLGFIPPEAVSPEKALKLLRYMDTVIAIRLNVHETLPRHLQKWRVNSGRVTFTKDGDFEMDLTSFSEDASHQWWFMDLRLLFSPSPEIDIQSRFDMHVKQGANDCLRQQGISGCFDFILSIVLTHKIAMLQSQAHQLARSAWFGAIKVIPVRRQLVVQYWTDRPGKKSWIEFGVSSNKPKNGKISWRGAPLPSLAARWFREGVEQKDVDLKFNYTNLSMERMLKRVIALHSSGFLRKTRAVIPANVNAKASLSENEPSECSLDVYLGRPDNKVTLSVEPVTGAYILRPRTRLSARAEGFINDPKQLGDPKHDLGSTLTSLLAQSLQDSIQRPATQLGWSSAPPTLFRSDIVKQATKTDVLRYTLFRPNGWTSRWALACIIDASGESWWIWELAGEGTKIEYTEKLALERTGPSPPISRTTLASIERVAVQQLAFRVTRRELAKQDIPCAVRLGLAVQPSLEASDTSMNASQGWALYMRTSDLLHAKAGEDAWIDPNIRLMSQGFTSDYKNVAQIASGTMVKSVAADMKKLMSASAQNNFIFSENGNFAILLTAPFGQPIVEELKARLRDIDRLRSFATILQKRKMSLRKSSLQAVQFQYGPDNMTATVSFKQDDEIQVEFGPNNPHNRIKTFLTEMINERAPFTPSGPDTSGLDRFCATLLFTRPVLVKLAELENATPGNTQNPAVHAHHVGKYRISYANPLCSFDIRLKEKGEEVYWRIGDNNAQKGELRPSQERNHVRIESLKTAITSLFKSQGEGWFGVRDSIIAPIVPQVPAIEDALQKLHNVVISCAMEGGYQHKMETPAPPPEKPMMSIQMPKREISTPQPVQPVQLSQPPAPTAQMNGNKPPTQANHIQQAQQAQQRRNFPNVGQNGPNVGRQPNGGLQHGQEIIELD